MNFNTYKVRYTFTGYGCAIVRAKTKKEAEEAFFNDVAPCVTTSEEDYEIESIEKEK